MSYILLIVFCAFVVEIIKEHKKIFTKRPEWHALLMVVLLGVSAYCIYNDNKETTGKIDKLTDGNTDLNKQIEVLKYGNDFLSNQMSDIKKAYDDSLKAVAQNMAYKFGVGVAKGDVNTTKILTDALSNKKELLYQIDSMRKKLDSCGNKETPPTLAIFETPTLSQKDTFGRKMHRITFKVNALNADAHITDAYCVLVQVTDGVLADTPNVFMMTAINYSDIIPKGGAVELYFDLILSPRLSRAAFAVNIDYKSKGDKPQKPLRKAYFVQFSQNYSISPLNSLQFGELGEYLKKYKIWPILYDL